MKVHLAIVAALLSLMACNEPQISTTYLCDKSTVNLNIINQNNAELTFNNHTYLLNRKKSALANKYINKFYFEVKVTMQIIASKKYQCTTS